MVNPYSTNKGGKKQRSVIETTRNEYNGSPRHIKKRHRNRDFFSELVSKIVSRRNRNKILLKFIKNPKSFIDNVLKNIDGQKYISRSYNVFNIGNANHIPSYSAEIALPMKNNEHIKALETLFKTCEKLAKDENLYLTGAMAIRFVKASKAYLSPMYNRDTCMVEIIMIKDNPHVQSIYRRLEESMRPIGARMHWGQYNFLTAHKIKSDFTKLSAWKKVASELNKFGVFNNAFSDRVGLSHY